MCLIFQPDLNEVAEVCLERLRLLASDMLGSEVTEAGNYDTTETNIHTSENNKDSLDRNDSVDDKDVNTLEADGSHDK
jgi:hypothetical protein